MSLRRMLGLGLVALLVYALTLVLTAPAARVLEWVDPAGVEVSGADGRIWAGRAQQVRLDRLPLPLTAVSWDVAVWRVMTGEIGGRVNAEIAGLQARGYLAATGARTLRIADLTLRGPVAGLVEQLPYPVAATGSLLARIEEGELVEGIARGVRGRAVWSDARLQAPLAVRLGEVIIDIEPDGEAHAIVIRAEGGEVEADGRVRTQADGRYTLELALSPTEQASERVRETLTLLARPDAQGRYVIRQSGRLR